MRNRLLCLLLCCCVLLLCGCGKKTPQQIFTETVKETLAQSAIQAHTQLDLQLSAQGVTMSVSVTLESTVQPSEAPTSATDITVSMLGMELSGNIYTVGDKRYVNQLGAKTVQESQTPSPSFYALLSTWETLSKEALSSLTAESGSGGRTILTGTFDGDQLAQTVSDSLQQFTGSAPFMLQSVDFTATVSRTGLFESITLQAPLVLDQSSESTDSVFSMQIDILETGDEVSVQLPDDLDSYLALP